VNQPRKVLKNTLGMGLSQTIDKAAAVYLSVFVARTLGARGLGVYSAAMGYYGLLYMAAEFGATVYLIREISKDRTQAGRYVVHLAVMSGGLALSFTLIARAILPFLGYSQELRSGLYIVIWAILPAVSIAIQEGVLIAYQKAEFLAYSSAIAAVVNVATTLYLLRHGFGVVSILAAFVLVQFVVTGFYFLTIIRSLVTLRWEFSFTFARKMLREMKAFTGSAVVQGLLSRPELILLSFTKNDAQMGFFSAALRLVDIWQLIPRVYMANVYPLLSKYHHAGDLRAHSVRAKSIKYMLAWSFPITAGMFILARPMVKLLYGSGFEASVPALRVLVWCIPLATLWNILWRVISARGEHGDVFGSQIITMLVRFGGGYVLIRLFGSLGAAFSCTISALVLVLLGIHKLRSDGTRLNFLPLTGRFALAAAGMAGVTFVLQNHLNFWVLVPVGFASYVVMVLLFKAFSPDDFSTFRRLWRVQST
jgi:O-antigen/teichoic acid export membrane protein